MGSFFYIFFLISLALTSLTNGDAHLIQKTCKTTKYYDFCVSTLKSDPTSVDSDTKGLVVILVGVATANATATSTFLSSESLNATKDTALKEVLKECSHKYAYASDALRASAQDLASEFFDYANMHVMAAADYPNACHNMFRRHPKLIYPKEVARREDVLKHLCDVILDIIDYLGVN
ncbi:Squalene monooxygenase [Hibiscus syriacus]|uniref:Squalene monooxygenase n=1 Tax=Hibiscus syriacus TaxID=106335 RepID=A0A6A2ZSR1_HIBSY|nr:cell wall / vacuolar inhibitor of fructosidase 2-like [Hibiscus syriacus]KAE8694938.1 Squalene monooxygenase [Hibiscus syriacus]